MTTNVKINADNRGHHWARALTIALNTSHLDALVQLPVLPADQIVWKRLTEGITLQWNSSMDSRPQHYYEIPSQTVTPQWSLKLPGGVTLEDAVNAYKSSPLPGIIHPLVVYVQDAYVGFTSTRQVAVFHVREADARGLRQVITHDRGV